MSNTLHASPHARFAALVAALSAGALAVLFSCSSDPPSPLGSEGDLLGSTPGTVYQDTISVYDDMVVAMNTLVAGQNPLEFGRALGYERAMVLQPGFANLKSNDKLRTVESANLRLSAAEINGSYPARFYTLGRSYTEGDAIMPFDTVAAIVDPTTGSADRLLQQLPRLYPLPPGLVQEWIRDTLDTKTGKYPKRVAITVLYTDALNDRVATFVSEDSTADRPRIEVKYTDAARDTFSIRGDATAYRDLVPPANLIVSDGVARRMYFKIHLDELAPKAAVHTARVRLHVVPGTVQGVNTTLVVYIPDDSTTTSNGFKSGQAVTEKLVTDEDEFIEFPITNAVFLMLQGTLSKNGFVLRFKDENTELRQVEFYGSAAAEPLRPRVYITWSTPAVFNP